MSKGRKMLIFRPVRVGLSFVVSGLLIWFILKPLITWLYDGELITALPDICHALVGMLIFFAGILGMGMVPVGLCLLLVALANAVLPHRKAICPHCGKVLMIFAPPSPEDFGNCPYCRGGVTKDTLIVE